MTVTNIHPSTFRDPDNPDAKDNFIAISGAYKILSDDQERAYFDSGRSSDSNNHNNVNVNDVFSSFFRGGAGGHGGQGGGGNRGGGFNFNFGGGGDDTDSMFANMFRSFNFGSSGSGGGRHANSHAHAHSHAHGRPPPANEAAVQQALVRFYAALGQRKSAAEAAALAARYRGRHDALYDKLRAKYGRDPREFLGGARPPPSAPPPPPVPPPPQRVKLLRSWLERFYARHGASKTAAELTTLARKYAGDPAPLYRKLEAKYGPLGATAW